MEFDKIIRRKDWYGLKPPLAAMISMPLVNPAVRWTASLALSSDALYRLPFRADHANYTLESGDRVKLLNPLIDQVAKDLLWGDGAPTSAASAQLLRYLQSHPGRIFLDIGAYSGLYALVAAKSGMAAIAFEILPENYLMVVENVIHNDLIEKVDARLCGLSDAAGTIVMPISTSSTSRPSSMSLAAEYELGVSVPLATIDSLGLDGPMLWKMDVEGFEPSVLRGARETIQRCQPDIICEVLPGCDTTAIREMLSGYTFLLAGPHGFERRPLEPDANFRDWLFTASPDAVPDLRA